MIEIIRFFAAILLALGILQAPVAEYTPLEDRAFSDEELNITPDSSKFIKIHAVDEGTDIYAPSENESFGYRYGPTILTNADGSIDAFFAAPGCMGEWDWIMYRHSPDGGKTWTDEKAVLKPTPDSPDFYSCCDPGVVKSGDYYYIGYTSTTNEAGVDNNVFVARSKTPDGPYEKWNGSGWGGRPAPIVDYTGDVSAFGAGEPSFVIKGDKLYIYYTWKDAGINQTRVAVADATDENWPASMEYKGVAIDYKNYMSADSADVKYIEDYGKFVAINTIERFTTNSFIGCFVSDDGITFRESCVVKENISHCCHNSGISSRPDGHIRLDDGVYLAYAYGDIWAYWSTRMNKVQLSLIDEPDYSELEKENLKTEIVPKEKTWYVNYIGITTDKQEYSISMYDTKTKVHVAKVDVDFNYKNLKSGVTFADYDESIVSFNGLKIVPESAGETFVTVKWNGFEDKFLIRVSG
ncbi:MAG: hypothetical protein J6L89_06520 [Clostridia bacterium]|nr:hypothetical protein [Clostridia bacterium]